MATTVVKSSGESEGFNLQKLVDSLVRSGATEAAALEIADKVEKRMPSLSSSRDIYKLAKRLLRRHNRVSGMRYSLKKALHALGPAGFRFEKYVARMLQTYGYSVKVDQVLEGYCVKHEVDIVALKDEELHVMECKYHSNGGNATDVKTALYVHARFVDLRKSPETKPGNGVVRHGWLVTNTRCTADAIKYAECAGLRIMSWKYPEKESLEKMIEAKKLYPVTTLHSATRKNLDALFRAGMILARDVAETDLPGFLAMTGLDEDTARRLKEEADELCPCE
jgi:hypothetical protein